MSIRLVQKGEDPLRGLIALSGASNSGKTFSSLRIATGIRDGLQANRGIAMLDTELRGNLYQSRFEFDRYVMDPPFSPKEWLAAFRELDVKYSVIISDNFSDEHEGIGGLCEMAAASTNPNDVAKWAKPKAEHKQLMAAIRLLKSQHIFLLRASEKIKIVKGQKEPEQLGWMPTCEKNFIYDVTLGWMLPPGSAGRAEVWKSIEGFEFKDGDQLSEAHGHAIARWITGQPTVGRSDMLDLVTICDPDGTARCTTSVLREALEAYAAAKQIDARAAAVVNVGSLRALTRYAKGKTLEKLQNEIAAVEAVGEAA